MRHENKRYRPQYLQVSVGARREEEIVTATTQASPEQADVDSLRVLLDDMANFADNDQRARFLLSSNWMRERLGRR